MSIEEQLRDAIDKHVGQPRADEAAWSELQRRVESRLNGRNRLAPSATVWWRPSWRSPYSAEPSHCCGRDLIEPDHPVGEFRSARDHPGWVDTAASASRGQPWNGGSLDRYSASVLGRVPGVGQSRRGWVRLRPQHADVGPHPTCPSCAIRSGGGVDRLGSDLPRWMGRQSGATRWVRFRSGDVFVASGRRSAGRH